jgi:2-polyprenyl-6-methoxyphenol hydroxylase-like FAD-dependent oxidoreductase
MLAEQSDFDVVIVGLGPVGAVAANLAGSLGLRTLVLERTDHAYLKPRAIVFDAEIMRVFDSIGLSARIAGASRALGGSIWVRTGGPSEPFGHANPLMPRRGIPATYFTSRSSSPFFGTA